MLRLMTAALLHQPSDCEAVILVCNLFLHLSLKTYSFILPDNQTQPWLLCSSPFFQPGGVKHLNHIRHDCINPHFSMCIMGFSATVGKSAIKCRLYVSMQSKAAFPSASTPCHQQEMCIKVVAFRFSIIFSSEV